MRIRRVATRTEYDRKPSIPRIRSKRRPSICVRHIRPVETATLSVWIPQSIGPPITGQLLNSGFNKVGELRRVKSHYGLEIDLDVDQNQGAASGIWNEGCTRIGRSQQRLHLETSDRRVLGEVENLECRIGDCARIESTGMCWGVGSGERIGRVPGMQRSNPHPMNGARLNFGAMGQVHENDPYLMASKRFRSTGSLEVPMSSAHRLRPPADRSLYRAIYPVQRSNHAPCPRQTAIPAE